MGLAESSQTLFHATCVAFEERAVLICGPSGSGKSDLALRLMELGALLVADDQVALSERDGLVWTAPPPALQGLIEAREVGILRVPFCPLAALALVVDLVGEEVELERYPDTFLVTLLGVSVPSVRLHSTHASTPVKVKALLLGRLTNQG